MDKRKRNSWEDYDVRSREYQEGLKKFVKLAFESACDGTIACPCSKCVRYHRHIEADVYDHLVINGPMRDFEKWFTDVDLGSTSTIVGVDATQEESRVAMDDVAQTLADAFGCHDELLNNVINAEGQVDPEIEIEQPDNENSNFDVDMFNKMLKDAEVELYPGCNQFCRLSFILHLYHIKTSFEWTDISLGVLLFFFLKVLPKGETVPDSLHEADTIIKGISLGYEKIHACPNDCMLFRKDKAKDDNCSVCGASRWKPSNEECKGGSSSTKAKKERKIPIKVLRYFPLKPRLQRLYMSSKTAEDMIWHDKDRKKENGVLRHPADTEAWQSFDRKYPE
ncbi:uncharacterized protein [Spinacia oleracea]|uniref:Transposase-associated domain-containing protein n=1 Tax=Spinacia oleracea TaxID=3562 RepID=A0ABM3RQ66_SPIOL|nr:uncharacterized protein LOC110796851 [Spinacia oleracea]